MGRNTFRIFVVTLSSVLIAVGCATDPGTVLPTVETAVAIAMTEQPAPQSETPPPASTPSPEPAKPIPTAPAITSTPTASLQPTATPTVLPMLAIEEAVEMVCHEPPHRFDLLEVSDFYVMADLRFESDDLITFEGWGSRPEPSVWSITPEPTPESYPIPNSSYRIMLTGGQLDPSSGMLSRRPLDVGAPLTNPCGEECPLDVLSQSPNGDWQLVQVNDWLRAQMGLWLVSAESAIRVVPYVPAVSNWQWAEDSSILWLDYTYHEAGGETLVFHLGDPPEARKVKVGYLLDPFWYWTGYSPIDNTVYAVPAPGMGHEDTELLFTIDLDDNLEVASGIWSVPGIASVAWNEATRSMIAQIVTEDGLLFQELSGDMTWSIPDEILAGIFPSSFISAANNLPNGFSASGEWAASPSGSKLALIHGYTVLWVFDCVAAP